MCYSETNRFTSTATTYGCTHKKDAVEAYKLQQSCRHEEFSVTPCGLVLSPKNHFLGHHLMNLLNVNAVDQEYVIKVKCHCQGLVHWIYISLC